MFQQRVDPTHQTHIIAPIGFLQTLLQGFDSWARKLYPDVHGCSLLHWLGQNFSAGDTSFYVFAPVPTFKTVFLTAIEYEDTAKRLVGEIPLTERDVDDILDYLCSVAHHRRIYYLWRPFLSDPRDDMVLELVVTAECDFIVTFNQSDFVGVEQFGLATLTPKEFLQKIGVVK
jgi:hypothetical protein